MHYNGKQTDCKTGYHHRTFDNELLPLYEAHQGVSYEADAHSRSN